MISLPNKDEIFSQQNKNREALHALRSLGFSLPQIRKALLALNGLRAAHLKSPGSQTLVYSAIEGRTVNFLAMHTVANALGLSMEELFEDVHKQSPTRHFERSEES